MKKEVIKGADVQESATANDDLFKANVLTSGAFLATTVLHSYVTKIVPTEAVVEAVGAQIKSVSQGDLTHVEGMLFGQATALQAMFLNLADRAKRADTLEKVQCLTQLALRAQSGSRNTLQTLIESKNPRNVAFVKQTNVAHTQQVNNGTAPSSRARNIKNEPIELLAETSHGGKKMDTRAEAAAVGTDKDMVSVEECHRANKRVRKAQIIS